MYPLSVVVGNLGSYQGVLQSLSKVMLQELAVDKANSQNVFSCINVDFLQFINCSLYAFFKYGWRILNIISDFLVCGHHCMPFYNQGFSSIHFLNGSTFHMRWNGASKINVSLAPLGRKFVLPFCFCFAFKSFESQEGIEWLSFVRTEPWVPTWEGVEWLSLVKIEPWVPTTKLSSCVPNLSKTEICEVGRPMRSKTDDFFDSFEDCSSSS